MTLNIEIGKTYTSLGAGDFKIVGHLIQPADHFQGILTAAYNGAPAKLSTGFRPDGKCLLFKEVCSYDLFCEVQQTDRNRS